MIKFRTNLIGKYCRLEALSLDRHGSDLWTEFENCDHIWQYLINGPYQDRGSFLSWLKSCEQHKSRIYYSVIDKISQKSLGVLCLIDCDFEHQKVEIGGIVFSPKLQKTTSATEAVFLLMSYVFEELKFRRLQWICNNKNAASKKAAKRFGFRPEGVHRQHMIVKGENRDTAFFSILDDEWLDIKSSFAKWLDAKNFDKDGNQKISLAAFRAIVSTQQ